MKTLQRITAPSPPATLSYWIKIYLKDPFTIKVLGPFSAPNAAQSAQAQIEADDQAVVSCFVLALRSPPTISDGPMSHAQWLQSLMENYLHIKVP